MDREVEGLIIYRNSRYIVRVDSAHLVTDTLKWASSALEQEEQEAELCQEEGELESLALHQASTQALGRFIDSGQPLAQGETLHYNLYLRQFLLPQVVGRDNLVVYAQNLIEASTIVQALDSPRFLLDLDAANPRLTGTEHIQMALRHASDCIETVCVGETELEAVISKISL